MTKKEGIERFVRLTLMKPGCEGVLVLQFEKKGAEIKFIELYAMNWDPVLSAGDFEGYHTSVS